MCAIRVLLFAVAIPLVIGGCKSLDDVVISSTWSDAGGDCRPTGVRLTFDAPTGTTIEAAGSAITIESKHLMGRADIFVGADASGSPVHIVMTRGGSRREIDYVPVRSPDLNRVPERVTWNDQDVAFTFEVCGVTDATLDDGTAQLSPKSVTWRLSADRFLALPVTERGTGQVALPRIVLHGGDGRSLARSPAVDVSHVLQAFGRAVAERGVPEAPVHLRGSPVLLVGDVVGAANVPAAGVTLAQIGAVAAVESTREVIETCAYRWTNGREEDRDRIRVDRTVTLREVSTRRVLARTMLVGHDPAPCPKEMRAGSLGSLERGLSGLWVPNLVPVDTGGDFHGSPAEVREWLSRQ